MADLKFTKLVLDGNSYVIPSASATEDGLMSSDDFSKLSKIPEGAEVNKIDEIQVNGVAVAIAQKIVDILITEGSENGKISVAGKDVAVKGLAALAYKATVTKTDLDAAVQAELEKIAANESAISTLNGTGAGSVKKTVDDAIKAWAELVTEDNETVDTFKELVEWVAKHGTEAGEFTTTINKLEAILKGIGSESEPETVAAYVQVEIAKLDNVYVKKNGNKVLSSNDFTNSYKEQLDNLSTTINQAKATYSYDSESGALTLNNIIAAI